MRSRKGQLCCCIALLCVNLAFIWGNSLMNAEVSGGVSGGLREWLAHWIPFLAGESGEHFLRKAAHFTEFASLGALLFWLVRLLGRKHPLPALLSAAVCAAVDECIQLFVPGRSGALADAVLDTLGAAAGIGLILVYLGLKQVLYCKKNCKEKKK